MKWCSVKVNTNKKDEIITDYLEKTEREFRDEHRHCYKIEKERWGWRWIISYPPIKRKIGMKTWMYEVALFAKENANAKIKTVKVYVEKIDRFSCERTESEVICKAIKKLRNEGYEDISFKSIRQFKFIYAE